MPAKYSAQEISDWFIAYASLRNQRLSAKKLQKLLYFSWAEYSIYEDKENFDEDLFSEAILAYEHGPVVYSVWKQQEYTAKKLPDGSKEMTLNRDLDFKTYGKTNKFLIKVWNTHGGKTPLHLERTSHKELPWTFIWDADSPKKEISKELIRGYYRLRPVNSENEAF